MTDADLARRAQRGDKDAFLGLIHRYHMPLYKLAYRFAGSVERAEDLCQEILIRAYLQIGKFDAKRPFQPWLMRTASNVCLNWNDGERRRSDAEVSIQDDLILLAREDVHSEVLARMESRAVVESVADLPNDTRLLIVMRFSLGMTFREISEQTGIKLPTVAARICRGIELIREALGEAIEVHE
jgi:RNA polymerase sigma-70 factor (ECF subfamily)